MQQAIIIVPPGDRIYLVFGWRVGSYKWKKARGVMLTHAVDYGGTTARQMQAVCIYGEQLQKAEDDAVDGWTRTIVDYFEVYNIHGNREEVPFTAPDPQAHDLGEELSLEACQSLHAQPGYVMATATLGHLSEDIEEDADDAMIELRAVSNGKIRRCWRFVPIDRYEPLHSANGVTCKFHYTTISPKQLDALKPEAWAFTKETCSRTRTRQRGLASTETRQYETHGVGVHTEEALENLDYEVDQPLRRSGRTHKVISGTYVEQCHRNPDAWLLREGRRASRRDLERKGGSVVADISRVTDAEGMADAMNVAEGGVVAMPARKVDAADTTAAEFTPTGQKRKRSISAPAEGKDVAAKPEDVGEKTKLKSPSPELEKPGTEGLPFEIIDSPPASPPPPALSRYSTTDTRTAVAILAPLPARAASMTSTASARPALPTPDWTPAPVASTANVDDDTDHATSVWRDRMEIMLMRKELEYHQKHGKRLE